MTTIKQLESQIKSLENQVRFLLEKVGKLPLNTGSEWVGPITHYLWKWTVQLQNLENDGCTNLKEWLEVHDTSKLFPGHCVKFDNKTYLYGWEQLKMDFHHVPKFNHNETYLQWEKDECPIDWVVLQSTQLRTDRGVK